jgi:toxin ParE1/3/4
MTRRNFRISKLASRDIEKILEYTLEHFGERKYEQYKALIREALAQIGSKPLAFPSLARADLYHDARTLHIARKGKPARHLFVYRVKETGVIVVLRLFHDAMDLARHLPEESAENESDASDDG